MKKKRMVKKKMSKNCLGKSWGRDILTFVSIYPMVSRVGFGSASMLVCICLFVLFLYWNDVCRFKSQFRLKSKFFHFIIKSCEWKLSGWWATTQMRLEVSNTLSPSLNWKELKWQGKLWYGFHDWREFSIAKSWALGTVENEIKVQTLCQTCMLVV